MIGLVLQGGGAKGGYQIGVWKALRELGIDIGGVTGTSVGALNGVMIAQGDFEKAYDIWYNMDPRLIIKDDPEIYHQLVTQNYDIKNMQMYFDYMMKIIRQKGLDIEPLVNLMDQVVDEEAVRDSEIDFGLVTISLSDWKAVEIFVDEMEDGKLGDYMLASAFLPAFKPKMILGKRYLDGGFHDNMPINLISRRGFSEIIAVSLDAMGIVKSVKDKSLKIRYIVPSGDTGSMLEFDKTQSRINLRMGYLDCMKAFGHYEGQSYYLEEVPEESFFISMIRELTNEQIEAMATIIGHKGGYPRRVLNEIIIPELSEMIGLDIEHGYKDIMVGALEFLASSMGIERLCVYTYDELLEKVSDYCQQSDKKKFDFEQLPDILRRRTLVRNNFKVDLLIRWMGISANIFEP